MLAVLLQRLMHVLMQYIDALSLGTPVFWCVRIVYVRPLLEYNSVIWSPHLKQDIDAIEHV